MKYVTEALQDKCYLKKIFIIFVECCSIQLIQKLDNTWE